jgi:phospholipid/cholesterol/gamma-HCH transport system permease protein
MGVNSANYLILPKLVAFIVIIPFLVMFSMVLGVMGGYIGAVELTNAVTATDYIFGIQYYFIPYYIVYSLIKSVAFAFIIVTVSAYYGYFTKGGALDVGRSSTKAVVHSTVTILLFNVLLTQLLLG